MSALNASTRSAVSLREVPTCPAPKFFMRGDGARHELKSELKLLYSVQVWRCFCIGRSIGSVEKSSGVRFYTATPAPDERLSKIKISR